MDLGLTLHSIWVRRERSLTNPVDRRLREKNMSLLAFATCKYWNGPPRDRYVFDGGKLDLYSSSKGSQVMAGGTDCGETLLFINL